MLQFKPFFMYAKYRYYRISFYLLVVVTLLYYNLWNRFQPEPRPKTILIKVDESTDPNFKSLFNHPWQLLLKTRRCSSTCAFVSRDKLYNRPFTQQGFDHVWLDEKLSQALSSKSLATVSSKESGHGMHFVFKPRTNISFVHTISSFDAHTAIPMAALASNNDETKAIIIDLGRGQLPYNLVSNAFRDYFEFGELARSLALNPKFPVFSQRKFMVAFLPDCRSLPPSHINYIVRLSKLVDLDLFGGCPELYKSNIKFQIPNFIDRMNLAGLYQYNLVIEPFNDPNYVSESFFEALVYHSLPVVLGANDLVPYLPDDTAAINARGFPESLERLVQHLRSISEQEWQDRLSWKKYVNNRKPSFSKLWDWSIESIICRICKASDARESNESFEFLPHHGSIDNEKLLMYLDQRRWYKEKKKARQGKHARQFKDGVLIQ
jgi:hypothetical protein